MVSAMRQILSALLVAMATSAIAAAQVNTLATMAIQGPLQALEKEYQQPGQAVTVTFDTSPNINKRLASGEVPDVLVAQTSTVDQMVSEITLGEAHGGKLVGPLPAAVRTYTAYDAIVMSGARAPDAARTFVRAITTPAAKKVLAASGWEF